MTNSPKAAGLAPVAPGRRLIAAGIISRRIDVRVTEAGVTGAIRKQVTR